MIEQDEADVAGMFIGTLVVEPCMLPGGNQGLQRAVDAPGRGPHGKMFEWSDHFQTCAQSGIEKA